MVDRYTRLRLRRRVKNHKQTVKSVGDQAGKTFDRHVLGRWRNLRDVRRFALGWLVLVGLLFGGVYLQSRDLSAFYQVRVPAGGGTFREGLVGRVTNMNPIFATGVVDGAAANLMFSSLFAYDEDNNIVGDLALGYDLNADGTIYTVNLRRDAYWHDGEQVTADDVVFTYETIQHPDTRSYLTGSWVGIKVQKVDDFTVTFALPNVFSPFINSLTRGGILPEHILADSLPGELRSHPFNTERPIGSGAFTFSDLSIDSSVSLVRMEAFEGYHRGRPQLDRFVLHVFDDREAMVDAYLAGELTAIGGLYSSDRERINSNLDSTWYDIPLNNGLFVFFKTTDPLLKETKLRRALVLATDKYEITEALDSRYSPIAGPLLRRHLGFSDKFVQPDTNLQQANKLLDELGWNWRTDGKRYKNNKPLEVEMVTQSSDDYPLVAEKLRDQWAEVGVTLKILAVDEQAIQESHIAPHNYQTLLFGVSLGQDADVFAYWHSSQSGPNGFNLSEYENEIADVALEGGRTRQDPALRAAKYHTFLEQWMKDHPAIAVYQPGYAYVQRSGVDGFNVRRVSSPVDRFYNVHLWRVNTEEVTRPR